MSTVYDLTDEFDKALDRLDQERETPPGLTAAAAYVHDTMGLAQISAKSIFGDSVTPDIAVAVYDRIVAVHGRENHSLDAILSESLDSIEDQNDTLQAIGKALGIEARPGESWGSYRLRIYARLGEV